jgi:hypothetical protein
MENEGLAWFDATPNTVAPAFGRSFAYLAGKKRPSRRCP